MDIKKGKNFQFFGEITIKASPPIYNRNSLLAGNRKLETGQILQESTVSDICVSNANGPKKKALIFFFFSHLYLRCEPNALELAAAPGLWESCDVCHIRRSTL